MTQTMTRTAISYIMTHS